MLLPLLILAVVGLLAMLDAGLRRLGLYTSTLFTWPAGGRAISPRRGHSSPYREDAGGHWILVVEAGIPRAVSTVLPPVLGLALLWSLCTVLALGDFKDVVRGTRSLSFVLASLSLCVVRALAGYATLLAAHDRRRGLFFLASGLALGLDIALACMPLPCSDNRSGDVHVALAGGAAQAALALGFAVALWRRRSLIDLEPPELEPPAPLPLLEDRFTEEEPPPEEWRD